MLHLLNGVPVSDAQIDHFGLGAGRFIEALDTLGEGALERYAPAFGQRIADHRDAHDARRAFIGNLTVTLALGIGLDVGSHQMGLAVRPVFMADQRIGRDDFHVPRIFPHFQVELHPVVGDQANRDLGERRRNGQADRHQERGEYKFSHPEPLG